MEGAVKHSRFFLLSPCTRVNIPWDRKGFERATGRTKYTHGTIMREGVVMVQITGFSWSEIKELDVKRYKDLWSIAMQIKEQK